MISEVAKQQIWQEKKAVFSPVSFLTNAQWGKKCHEIISVLINPRDHLQASYNLDSELKFESVGRNHSDLNELPKIAKISLKNAKIIKIIGNC